jgi:alpha-glucosidase (family GH31 glycosyl hydrolase)
VRGLPLRYPEHEAAYRFDGEYLLGDQLLVAPVTEPGAPVTTPVWIPPGTWVDWFTGKRYQGPSLDSLTVPLDRMPLFVKEGSIVPLQSSTPGHQAGDGGLHLRVTAGRSTERPVYHDAGTGIGYQKDAHAWQPIRWTDSTRALRIGAVDADRYAGQPADRAYRITITGVERPRSVVVQKPSGDAARTVRSWTYDPASRTATIDVPAQPTRVPVTIALRDDTPGR